MPPLVRILALSPASLVLALPLLFAAGCATHVPASETVLFHHGSTTPTHHRTSGFGLTATYAPTGAVGNNLADREYPSWTYRDEGMPINPHRPGVGPYFSSYDSQGLFAFSATVGVLTAGVDATVKVLRKTYVTAALSAPKQGQLYVQHRLFNTAQAGGVVGAGARYDTYGFSADHYLWESRGATSVGVRGFLVYRAKGDSGGGVKIGTYAGYVPDLESPLITFTLMVGGF